MGMPGGPIHQMPFAPPNAIAYNFGPPGPFPPAPQFTPDFPCFPPQENTFPSPPHLQGDFPNPCFPSPPNSDCSPPPQPQPYIHDQGLSSFDHVDHPTLSTSF